MVKIYFWLANQRRKYLMRKAIQKANLMLGKTGAKFYCLWYKGKPLVKSKQNLKELVKQGVFQKGMTIHDIENLAFYKTR